MTKDNLKDQRKIEVDSFNLVQIMERLEDGFYAIPIFQRDFVWDTNNIKDLWDSIYRHYPIGSFLIWETNEKLPRHRNIFDIELRENEKGNFNYILDGQQRIHSIISAVRGAKKNRTSLRLFFNLMKAYKLSKKCLTDQLNDSPFLTEREYKKLSKKDNIIPLEFLMEFNSTYHRKLEDDDLAEFYRNISERLRVHYEVSVINLNNVPIEEVCDIFTRVNQKGKKLSLVDLVVAKTYRQDEFYLRDNLEEFENQLKTEGFGGIDDLVFLRCLSVHKSKKCTESDILDLTSNDFIDLWDKSTESVIRAVRFLKDELGIVSPKILPYTTMIVPLSYFFFKLGNKTYFDDYKDATKKWFWRSSFSGNYQSHTNDRIHADCEWFEELLVKKDLEPNVSKFKIDIETIIETELNLNNAACNSILCLLAYLRPIDFYNHQPIKINEILLEGKKSELHHIFPKKSKTGKKNSDQIDSIVNICFLPRDTNKLFNNKEPKDYLALAQANNKDYFISDIGTHLIPISRNSPVWESSFESFLKQRAQKLKDEITKILDFKEVKEEEKNEEEKGE